MRLPTKKDRILVNGHTGSGKTTAAVWILSNANFTEQPWIVFNQKCTAIIDQIPGAKHVKNNFRPTKPGIYIYHHVPGLHDEELEALMWYVWAHGGIGVYIDEGYMIDVRSEALTALYTQGREKEIPMITLSQRPMKIQRFAISESEFYMLFKLNDKDDRKRVQGFIPTDLEKLMVSEAGTARALPKYHSLYYDVEENSVEIIRPVPDKSVILQTFKDRFSLSKHKNRLL